MQVGCRLEVSGIVQGVGFRPFVYQLAKRYGLTGWVFNHAGGVTIEVEGKNADLQAFQLALQQEAPPLAVINNVIAAECQPHGHELFMIKASEATANPTALISPDVVVCEDCLAEMNDPTNRRYRYPFINCTNCGPRYTIIRGVPYDRPQTTMAKFPMCPACQQEYENPADRRFHAQPNACPVCGPQYRLLDRQGQQLQIVAENLDIFLQTKKLLAAGKIAAIKGLGGYHLACDAKNELAVAALRQRKVREDKPFAVMAGSLAAVRRLCQMPLQAAKLLNSPAHPIVLLTKGENYDLAAAVAPDNPMLGIMLPYAPVHFLLLGPEDVLVMTSGNVSDEPIAFADEDALQRLSNIADLFLLNDRPIYCRADDSVTRLAAGGPYFIRRSRGYVPAPLKWDKFAAAPPLLAVGAELKNTFCLTRGSQAFLSVHNGDLENLAAYEAYCQAIEHYCHLLAVKPEAVACDLHPEYLPSKYARELNLPLISVQHHHAHLAAVLAEHELDRTVIGVAYDGSGFGSDGRLWGGEILVADCRQFSRFAHCTYLPLPGGAQAVREPWRLAAWFLASQYGADWVQLDLPVAHYVDAGAARQGEAAESQIAAKTKWQLLLQAASLGLNAPLSSSAGRLFDLTASLLGIRQVINYEGQAAVELELAAAGQRGRVLPYRISKEQDGSALELDLQPALRFLCEEKMRGCANRILAADFHTTLAAVTVELVIAASKATGIKEVALSGGVFQNITLLEQLLTKLAAQKFTVYLQRQVPVNDGGLALGQAAVAAACLLKA